MKVGEQAARNILRGNKLPRRVRRDMGRIYGKAGYRKANSLPPSKAYTPHPTIVGWVAEQTALLVQKVDLYREGLKNDSPAA